MTPWLRTSLAVPLLGLSLGLADQAMAETERKPAATGSPAPVVVPLAPAKQSSKAKAPADQSTQASRERDEDGRRTAEQGPASRQVPVPRPPAPAAPPPSPGGRYVILELYQAQRDLNIGDPRINLMFDSRDGRSWILRYGRLPGSDAQGYIWAEVPRRAAPQPAGRR